MLSDSLSVEKSLASVDTIKLANHPDVAECAVIGASDALKGQLPIGFVCLTKGVNRPHSEIARECVQMIRDKIGPVAAFKTAAVVDRLPKTRSPSVLTKPLHCIATEFIEK